MQPAYQWGRKANVPSSLALLGKLRNLRATLFNRLVAIKKGRKSAPAMNSDKFENRVKITGNIRVCWNYSGFA